MLSLIKQLPPNSEHIAQSNGEFKKADLVGSRPGRPYFRPGLLMIAVQTPIDQIKVLFPHIAHKVVNGKHVSIL